MEIIAHFDEIFLKGNNQPFFVRRLSDNLQKLFKGVKVKRAESGGLLISGMGEDDLDRLGSVPGIANFAPVWVGPNDMDSIKKIVSDLNFPENVKTFRVTASRSDKKYPLSSNEIDRILGEFVMEKYGWKVNLKNFDLEIRVDVGPKEAKVYFEMARGAGGLPTGSSGRILCLLSGGIDSPVAAYQMMKRGAEVGLIHFQNESRTSVEVSQKIFDLARALAGYQPGLELFIVPFAEYQKQVVMKIPAKYRMLVYRRLMFRIAETVAKKYKYRALATGDSLGQVASQTLQNMEVVYEAAALLKMSPLIGNNKSEIVKIAQRLGTLSVSERPYEDCCSMFVAPHPETRARLSDILRMEKGLVDIPLDKNAVKSYYIGID